MVLPVAAIFGAPIREDPQERKIVFLEEGEHTVVQKIGNDKRILSVVKLGHRHFGIRIHEGLLVDPADASNCRHRRCPESQGKRGVPSRSPRELASRPLLFPGP